MPPSKVYIVGAFREPSERYKAGRSITGLLARAARGIGPELLGEVREVVILTRYPGSFDPSEFLDRAGLPQSPVIDLSTRPRSMLGGVDAVRAVWNSLVASEPRTVLVVGGDVFSAASADGQDHDARRELLSAHGGLHKEDQRVGLTALSAHALIADAFFRSSGCTLAEMDALMCAVACHLEKYAYLNPHSYQRSQRAVGRPFERITPEYYRKHNDRSTKWPFSRFDICGITDVAAAIVLTNRPPAKGVDAVEIPACFVETRGADGGLLARQQLSRSESNRRIWRRVREVVPLPRYPVPEPDERRVILELLDVYTYQVAKTLIEMEMFSDIQTIIKGLEEGFFDPAYGRNQITPLTRISEECRVILNPSGGSRDGHPHGAYALLRAVQSFQLLTGAPAEFSLPTDGLEYAVIHALTVFNTSGVLVLRKVDGDG